jgi:hypothetical protein
MKGVELFGIGWLARFDDEKGGVIFDVCTNAWLEGGLALGGYDRRSS